MNIDDLYHPPQSTLYCSFCGKSQHEVRKLIAGPEAFICDECTDLSHELCHPVEAMNSALQARVDKLERWAWGSSTGSRA